MIGRRQFGLMGLSAVGVATIGGTLGGRAAFASDDSHKDHAADECAKACSDCQRECDSCATHCANLLAQGKKEHAVTLGTCQDCADFCVAAAQIVARKGPMMATICEPCAKACSLCAKECEKFPNDAHMKKCAEECRKCEKACIEMIKHVTKEV
jgi:hypothetical protein